MPQDVGAMFGEGHYVFGRGEAAMATVALADAPEFILRPFHTPALIVRLVAGILHARFPTAAERTAEGFGPHG
jgi:hypothetical protein